MLDLKSVDMRFMYLTELGKKNYPTLITAVVFPSMKQRIKRSDIRFIETVVFILIAGN